MSDNAAPPGPLRVADLAQNSANSFEIRLDSKVLKELAAQLGLITLRKLRFAGDVIACGKHDWRLDARLGVTVVQACVVTLAPVSTRIDRDVKRQYLANWSDPTEEEIEMPEDDSTEPLGAHIDLHAVMVEALMLALPLYPRAQNADLAQAIFTEPGQPPMSDEAARPFAGLRDILKEDE